MRHTNTIQAWGQTATTARGADLSGGYTLISTGLDATLLQYAIKRCDPFQPGAELSSTVRGAATQGSIGGVR